MVKNKTVGNEYLNKFDVTYISLFRRTGVHLRRVAADHGTTLNISRGRVALYLSSASKNEYIGLIRTHPCSDTVVPFPGGLHTVPLTSRHIIVPHVP